MIEERLRRPRPHGDVDEDARGARITATLSDVTNDQPDPLVARAGDPEPIGALTDLPADLGYRNERIIMLQDQVRQLRREASG